jgi:hypothetical protein
MANYIIYGKSRNMKTFKAMDMQNGCPVGNIIRATVFWDTTKEKMDETITELENSNFGWQFKHKKTN